MLVVWEGRRREAPPIPIKEAIGRCPMCRDRHLIKTPVAGRAQWLADRSYELFDTRYFHAVFTALQQIAAIAVQNKEIDVLFRAASETLRAVTADREHLRAMIGFTTMLGGEWNLTDLGAMGVAPY
jgi:hypothetical protein